MFDSYVYVLRMRDTNYYKIGMTNRAVEERLLACQTGNPFKLEITHVFPTDEPIKLEKSLHERFKDQQLEGEWFSLFSEDLLDLARVGVETSFDAIMATGTFLIENGSIDDREFIKVYCSKIVETVTRLSNK